MSEVIQGQKPFAWKEFTVNVLLANIPASILIVLAKMYLGITGALIPIIFIFGGAAIIGSMRKRKGHVATYKSILLALAANIIFFFAVTLIVVLM